MSARGREQRMRRLLEVEKSRAKARETELMRATAAAAQAEHAARAKERELEVSYETARAARTAGELAERSAHCHTAHVDVKRAHLDASAAGEVANAARTRLLDARIAVERVEVVVAGAVRANVAKEAKAERRDADERAARLQGARASEPDSRRKT